MKFSITMLAGLVGFAMAQSSTSSGSASGTSSSLSPTQTCLAACATGDVNCQAACLGNPYPNAAQVNATTECSSHCVQGNGTQAETQQYADCLAACRASYFLSTGTNFVGASTAGSNAAATGSSGSAPAGNSAAATSGSQSGTPTASASQTASSKGAASALEIGVPFAGVVGIFLAALAL
ncbi:hypothetical protein ANO11243_040190 [Dothideomycetidae sp. 11243]|nr:hypothetical protein ANO11243_040190 [fungal sp. No.11243]